VSEITCINNAVNWVNTSFSNAKLCRKVDNVGSMWRIIIGTVVNKREI
jgi:hypothetical protein